MLKGAVKCLSLFVILETYGDLPARRAVRLKVICNIACKHSSRVSTQYNHKNNVVKFPSRL